MSPAPLDPADHGLALERADEAGFRGALLAAARSEAMTIDAYVDERRRLEESLRESREQLEVAVGDLKQAARETLTPGEVIARRPYVWLLGALAVGLYLGHRSAQESGSNP